MPELALESFAPSSEIGQLPNITKSASEFRENFKSMENRGALFTAILKALALLGNKPSFAREIADSIVKYKLAALGESSPYVVVSDILDKHFEQDSRPCSSASVPLLKVEDPGNPGAFRYSLPYSSDFLSFNDEHSTLPPFSNKRASLAMNLPNKKMKSRTQDQMLAPLPFEEDWLSDNTQSSGVENFDQCFDTFEFDTIVPISYMAPSTDHKSLNGASYDSDISSDEHSEIRSRSYVESLDSENEMERLDFCEDMMNGDLDFNLSSNAGSHSIDYEHGSEFTVPLSDHDFHSDSSHSSAESGTSTASPLLTPESSPRRDSGVTEKMCTIQPSIYGDNFVENWELGDSLSTISTSDPKESKPDTLSNSMFTIPQLDELMEVKVDNLTVSRISHDILPLKHPLTSDDSSLVKRENNIPQNADVNLVPCIEDQVSSFLYLDDEDDKLLSRPTSEVRKANLECFSDTMRFQPTSVPTPATKSSTRNSKNKNRIAHNTEYNPNMLIPSILPLSFQISITMVESLPFYVATVGPAEGFSGTHQLLRRYDSGYVNATTLLTAGGMESEKEQAIVLSLEIRRMRIRRQESPLFGTWIPLQRARALAATCSLQQKLGPFLDYDLPSYFPSQLPPHIAAFNPDQVSTRLHQFIRTRAASLKPRDNYVANIGIAPRCLHPTSKSFFSGVGHQLNQILGLQSKQLKSHSTLEDTANPRRPTKRKSSPNLAGDYAMDAGNIQDDGLDIVNIGNMDTFIEGVDFDIDEEAEEDFLRNIL